MANYSSDDSEDEKPKKNKSAANIPKIPDLTDTKTFEKMTNQDKNERGADRELKM